MSDNSELQNEATEFAERLGKIMRQARKLEARICEAAENGDDVADAARFDVNMVVASLQKAIAHAGAAHRLIPEISVRFGGGK